MKVPHLITSIAAAALVWVTTTPDALAAKEKFVRNKPHVNVSGPYHLDADTLRISVGLVDPAVQGDLAAPVADGSCTGTISLRVMNAADPEGAALAERPDLALTKAGFEALEYAGGSGASEDVYAVIAAEDMDVDGKRCTLRARVQVRDTVSGHVDVDKTVFRQEFGQVKIKR